ncbi:MAG: hypothetical protein U1F66_08665 [bacterium]
MNSRQSKQTSELKSLQESVSREKTSHPPAQVQGQANPATEHQGPHWQVRDSKPTPFVADFFLSHPDKVLGI